MQRVREFAARPLGYAALLGVGIAFFLIAIGLDSQSLPFPRNADFSDAATTHWPNALFLGRAPFTAWNPYIMNGTPFALNPLNKVWYPPQWIALVLPPTLHLNLMLWLHMTLAGVGMRAFARRIGQDVWVAALLGVAYALTPRLVAAAGAGHLDVVYAAAWLPWLLWAVQRGDGLRGALETGFFAALCFLADVRISALVFALAGAYALLVAHRRLVWFVISAAFAIGLTAVQWLPLLSELPKLSRAGLTVQDAGVFSLRPALAALGLLIGIQGSDHEFMVYVGITILALAILGIIVYQRKVWFWWVVAIIAGLYALGSSFILWPILVRLIPPLLWLRVPARAWILAAFALIILAGYGLQAMRTPSSMAKRGRWIPRIGAGLLVIGLPLAAFVLRLDRGSAVTSFIFIGATGIMLLFYRRVSLGLWAFVMVLDLLAINTTLIEGVWQPDWLGRYEPIARALLADHVDEVYSPSYSLPQQAAVFYQIPIIGGVDPFQYADYVQRFEQATGVRSTGYTVTLPAFEGDPATVNENAPIDLAALAAAPFHVSHIASAFPIENPALQSLGKVEGVYLYRNTLYSPSGVPEPPPNLDSLNHRTAIGALISMLTVLAGMFLYLVNPGAPVVKESDAVPG